MTFIEVKVDRGHRYINRHLIISFNADHNAPSYTYIQMHNGDAYYAEITVRSLLEKLK